MNKAQSALLRLGIYLTENPRLLLLVLSILVIITLAALSIGLQDVPLAGPSGGQTGV